MKILKELAISLSAYEKKSLLRFLLVYLASTYLFAALLSLLFYELQVQNLSQTHRYKMENLTTQISNRIIAAHMRGDNSLMKCFLQSGEQCFGDIPQSKEHRIGLYDIQNKAILQSFDIDLQNKEHFFIKDKALYFIDNSPQGHLGVKYIVAQYPDIAKEIFSLQTQVAIGLAVAMIFLTLVGVFLARLFLAPIKAEINRLNTFIKDSTHELNTPISAILMSINSLKDIEEKKRKRITLSAKRISDLYQNLCYMLLRDTQLQESKQMLELEELIQDRLQYFADFIEIKRLHVATNLDRVELLGAKESLVKLIDNLISNAIKYSDFEGQITITLTREYLEVKDKGIGIKKELQKEIFKRYKRANTAHGGFGIGLDIANTVCKEHGFRLELDSQLDIGSSFRVYF